MTLGHGWQGYVSLPVGKNRVEIHNEALPASGDLFTAIEPLTFPAAYTIYAAFDVAGTLAVHRTYGATGSYEYLNEGESLLQNNLYSFSVISGQSDSISLTHSATSGNIISLYVVENKGGAGTPSAQGNARTLVTIASADLSIGAVEIKDASTDTRATVDGDGLHVNVQASVLPSGAATESTLAFASADIADIKNEMGATDAAIVDAGAVGSLSAKLRRLTSDLGTILTAIGTAASAIPAKVMMIGGSDGTNARAIATNAIGEIKGVGGYTTTTAVIAQSGSLSAEVDIGGYHYLMFAMPTMEAGTTYLSFQVASAAGGTFQNLYDDAGNEVLVGNGTTLLSGITVGVNIAALKLGAGRFLKIRAGTSASPVAQATAERTITLILKG